jgi:hypothetical protein
MKVESMRVVVTDVRFSQAGPDKYNGGLLGWVSLTVGGLRLDGIAVRRTADGRFALSFPARRDAAGRQHPYVLPLDDATQRDLEHQVFAAIGLGESATR